MTDFPHDRERDIRAYLKKHLALLGGALRKVTWFQRRGAPDEFVLLPHIDGVCGASFAFVELKRPGLKPEPHQQRVIDKLRAHGGPVFVLTTREEVDRFLFWRHDR